MMVEGSRIGLTSREARERLARYGPNVMPEAAPSTWRSALGKFWAPVPWMLEAAIILQLVVHEYVPAAVIAFLLVLNAALAFFQESRAQATLDALKRRLTLSASALRDGAWRIVPAADVVPGDVVKLSLGTIVPADARILQGSVLLDQSLLTGESLPIEAGRDANAYAGTLVLRGEAIAEVTATGVRTTFGRTAELVRGAHVESSQQKAVFRVVRNLAFFNGGLVCFQLIYASALRLSAGEMIALVLVGTLASVPVALPAAFTLATAIGARNLARRGVLPTRLSAVDEAATMTVLCVDKTGTITQNELEVVEVEPLAGDDRASVLRLAALASATGTLDPVDAAVTRAARSAPFANVPKPVKFVPFDPARKMSEAIVTTAAGETERIVKGAFPAVAALAAPSETARAVADELERKGFRVLAVAHGPPSALRLAGLIALSDMPRPESAELLSRLREMGVRPVMLTGDTPATAASVAQQVHLEGAVCRREEIPARVRPEEYAVFAGILPEDKYRIVKAFQADGRVVGMCGDGANDAPALRQAQIGIAVSTATDVAKSAAGIVLTEPGLGGIVAAVEEGRITFQRILTYALRSITGKIKQVFFLTSGLLLTGNAILTPVLMALLMMSGDFLALSATTDNVRPSARPNDWKIDRLTIAGVILGTIDLIFSTAFLALGKFWFGLSIDALRTLAALLTVFTSQALFYVARERRHLWESRPSNWFIASSVVDASIISALALRGILMAPLPLGVVASVAGCAVAFAFLLDFVKLAAFRRLSLAE
jgi:H+-transporting ATPase